MKNLKRALCLFLALVMCLSMLPMNVFAADIAEGAETGVTEETGNKPAPEGGEADEPEGATTPGDSENSEETGDSQDSEEVKNESEGNEGTEDPADNTVENEEPEDPTNTTKAPEESKDPAEPEETEVEIPEDATEVTADKLTALPESQYGKAMSMDSFFGLIQSSNVVEKETKGFLGGLFGGGKEAVIPEKLTFVVDGEELVFEYAKAKSDEPYEEKVTVTEDAILLDDVKAAAVYAQGEAEVNSNEPETLSIGGKYNETIAVGESLTLNGNGNYHSHEWLQSGTGHVEFSSVNTQSTTITGVTPGTMTITHKYKYGDREQTETMTVTVSGAPVLTRVYVYVQLDTTGFNASDWNLNKDGWYTIGYIDVEGLPKPGTAGVSYRDYRTQIDKALQKVQRHNDNKDKAINMSHVSWTENGYGLKSVDGGATGYVGEGTCWHLDGYLQVVQTNILEVNYSYHVVEPGQPALHETVHDELNINSEFTVDVPRISGYVAVVKLGDTVVGQDELSGHILSDLTYEVVYHKDANGNGIPDCEDTVTVSYSVSGDVPSGYNKPADATIAYNSSSYTVAAAPATQTGNKDGVPGTFTFDGWYNGNSKVTSLTNVTENVTLTGTWTFTASNVTVTFDGNAPAGAASNVPDDQTVTYNTVATEPTTDPTLDGYTFDGWYTEPRCENAYDFSTPVTQNITLYAKWVKTVPALTATKTDGRTDETSKVYAENETIHYTITIDKATGENADNGLMKHFSITDKYLPDSASKVTVTVGGEAAEYAANGGLKVEAKGDSKVLTFELAAATGETVTVEYDYTVTAADVEAGKITNQATIKAWFNGTEPEIPTPPQPEIETPTGKYSLTVTKVISSITKGTETVWDANKGELPETVAPGSTINYTITVANSGKVAATGVKLGDWFKVGGETASLTTGPVAADVDASDFTVPAEGSVEFTATYKVKAEDAGKTISNSAAAAVDEEPTEPEVPGPAIEVENKSVTITKTVSGKTGADGKAKVGDTLYYNVRVTNTGNVALTDLVINDTFTVGGQAVSADLVTIIGRDATKLPGDNGEFTGFTLNEVLPVNGIAYVMYRYTVQPGDAGKTLTNTAAAEGGTATTTTEVDKLISSVTKTLVTDGDYYTEAAGQNVTLTDGKLVVKNAGQAITLVYRFTVEGDAGASFTINDKGAALVADSVKGGTVTAEDGVFTGTVGENGTVTFDVAMEFPYIEGTGYGELTNRATVENAPDDIPDPTPEAKSFTVKVQYVADDETDLNKPDYVVIVPENDKYNVTGAIDKTIPVGDKDYVLDSINGVVSDTAKENVTITATYSADEKGNPTDPTKPDGTPDKYQWIVTYEIVHGTWDGVVSSQNTKPQYEVVTFATKNADGTWTELSHENGMPLTEVPTGIAASGYSTGVWSVSKETESTGTLANGKPASVTGDATFILTFDPGEFGYTVEYYYDEKLGATENDKKATLGTKIPYETTRTTYNGKNYVLDRVVGANKTVTAIKSDNVVKVYYLIDEIGTTPGKPNEPDGTPDKYQATVTYKVVNGYWEEVEGEKDADDKTYVVNLYTQDADTGEWTPIDQKDLDRQIPTGMQPNTGYKAGDWDKPPETAELKPGVNNIFTYSFVKDEDWTHTALVQIEYYKAARDEEGTVITTGANLIGSNTANNTVWIGYPANVTVNVTPDPNMLVGYEYRAYAAGNDTLVYESPEEFKHEIAAEGASDTDPYVIKVYYIPAEYTITYKDVESATFEGTNPATYTVEDNTFTLSNPTKEGYTFLGWTGTDLNDATVKNVTIKHGSTGNREYTAVWTPTGGTKFTVEHWLENANGDYELDEDKYVDTVPGTLGDTVNAADYVKTITGYQFNSKAEGSVLTATVEAEGKTVLKLYYDRQSYTVSYAIRGENPGATAPAPQENVKLGATVTVADPAAADGYVFSGWSHTGVVIKDGKFNMPAYDLTLVGSFTKRTDLTYTVNYLEKDTKKVLHDAETVTGKTFGETYTETAENIPGYTVDEQTKSVTMTTGTNEITFFYTKRTDLSYTVNYLEKDTGKVLAAEKTVDNQVFNTTVYAADVEKADIPGYTYDSASVESITISADNSANVINLYYTANQVNYTVNYVEQGTDNVLRPAETKEGKTGETVTESAYDIPGYTLVSDRIQTLELKANADENVITFEYAANTDTAYKVEHYKQNLSGNGYTLADTEDKTGTTGGTATATAKTYTGFTYDSSVEGTVASGEIAADGSLVLKLYYTRSANLTYTVNYLEKDTNKVLQTAKSVENQKYGTVIVSAAEVIAIDGYKYESASAASITIDTNNDANVLNLYYTKRADLAYTVNYLEKDTNKVLKPATTVYNAAFGDEITVETEGVKAEIAGYTYASADKETLTIGTNASANVLNLYYTKRTDVSYTVNYLEQDTNKVLHDAKTVTGKTFGEIVTEHAEVVPGYVTPVSQAIILKAEGNVINFYYVKSSGLSYTVRYVEVVDGKQVDIAPSETITGLTLGESKTEKAIDIPGYELADGQEPTRTFEVKANTSDVVFVYTKLANLSYTVNYYLKDSTTPVATSKVVRNQTFGTTVYTADEYKSIDGYNYDSADKSVLTIGTNDSDNVINLYYTARTDLSYTVNYLEKDTNNVLKPAETVNGQKFGSKVEVSAAVIPGYNVEGTGTQEITIAVTGNVITFYYTKQADVTINYVSADGTMGTVSSASESLNPAIGEAKGSEANAKPGYHFVGWYTDEACTTLAAVVTGNKLVPEKVNGLNVAGTYYAKFVVDDDQTKTLHYTVVYYKNGLIDEKSMETVEKDVQVLQPDTMTVDKSEINTTSMFEGFALDKVEVAEGTSIVGTKIPETVNNGTVIKVYYATDEVGTIGVPDKYELKVTFQVKNGAWTEGNVDDVVIYLPKYEAGTMNFAEDGKATLELPESLKAAPTAPAEGFQKIGAWDNKPVDGGELTEDTVYVFTYTANNELTVEATPYVAEYDGESHNPIKGLTITMPGKGDEADQVYDVFGDTEAPKGLTITYKVGDTTVTSINDLADIKNVGDTPKPVEITVTYEGYNPQTVTVEAKITPKTLTVTTESASKTHNGTALTAPGSISGLVGDETVTFTVTGSQTEINKSTNTYKLDWDGTAEESNYVIKENLGTLIVIPSDGSTIIVRPDPNPNPGGGDVDIEDEDPPLANVDGNLNTTDHFAYIIGRGENCVQPLENITRAEVATIFFRLLTEDFRVANWSTVSSFPDVEAGAWYATEIATAERAGILKGCDDGNMQPDRDITRAEFTVMAIRFLNGSIADDGTGDFADTANHWAAKEIRLAAKAGWIKGYGNNFRPNDPITRAEAMTIINRMLDRVPGDTFPAGTIEWGDNPKGAWYYADVMEATNGHDYEREEGSVVEKWTAITPYRDWIALEAEWTANNGASAPASEEK